MNSKEEKISRFNPNDPAGGSQLYGLPFTQEESDIVVVPVPWEVTVSYHAGTARAPKAILEASKQVDLFDADVPGAWKRGIFLQRSDKKILRRGEELRKKAVKYLDGFSSEEGAKKMEKSRDEINEGGQWLKNRLKKEFLSLLSAGKLPVLLGGDHSTPLGFIEALAEVHPDFGILQVDAHCDLRNAYEGLEYSHASIMFNALKIQQVSRLVQVGIRDWCDEEMQVIQSQPDRVKVFFDAANRRRNYEGVHWKTICDDIVDALPSKVYVSFDIDGLDPKLCPNTGTPVPGGLEFEQAVFLLRNVVSSGRTLIGCDLNEVAPGLTDWDANVAARLLYKMCNLMAKSNPSAKEYGNQRNDEVVLLSAGRESEEKEGWEEKEEGD
jgi:agmatinase